MKIGASRLTLVSCFAVESRVFYMIYRIGECIPGSGDAGVRFLIRISIFGYRYPGIIKERKRNGESEGNGIFLSELWL